MPDSSARRRLAAAGVVLCGLLASVAAPAGSQPEPPAPDKRTANEGAADVAANPMDSAASNQFVVRMAARGTVTAAKLTDLSQTASAVLGGERLELVRTTDDGSLILRVSQRRPAAEMATAAAMLQGRADVAVAEPDLIATPNVVPDDPRFPELWGLANPAAGSGIGINAPGAWGTTTGDPDLVVAVLDTGQTNHPDLDRQVPGYDLVFDAAIANDGDGRDADSSDPGDWITPLEASQGTFRDCPISDSSWHGTHVAGTIGASTNNQDVVGVNLQSGIQHVRVLGKCGGFFSDVADGIRWAAGLPVGGTTVNPTPARVINMSLGGFGACPSLVQSAINAATSAGAIVVVSAGNDSSNAASYTPANCRNVITVAATGKAGNRAYYSNFGATVEISAPGGDTFADAGDTILSTLNSGTRSPGAPTLARYQGTSMAAPHVSGVVSLMLSVNPDLTLAQVTSLLKSTATPFPARSTCTRTTCGPGIVNADVAVGAAAGEPGPFRKTAPRDRLQRVSVRPTLRWSPSARATSYEYCMDTTDNGRCDADWVNVRRARSARITKSLDRGTTYYWQVRAVNDAGLTAANSDAEFSFTTR